jgi:hypothetical protein
MADLGIDPSTLNGLLEKSTSIKILVNKKEIGSIASYTQSETRDITDHFTLGGTSPEDPKALVSGIVRNKTIKCDGFAIWKAGFLTAFENQGVGDPIKTLKDQKTYFSIQEQKTKPDGTEVIVTTFEDCLIQDYTTTKDIGRGDIRISESVTIRYRVAT